MLGSFGVFGVFSFCVFEELSPETDANIHTQMQIYRHRCKYIVTDANIGRSNLMTTIHMETK